VSLDVDSVRACFPALAEGAAHFDGPGGSQVPTEVAQAVAAAMTAATANRGEVTLAERRAEEVVIAARRALADLLGADPGGVVFGRSMTQLTYDFSRTLARSWRPGDEIVVTRMDHDANVRPWVQAAAATGAVVRWASFDKDSGVLPAGAVTAELSERTRLVAVTGASNLMGSRPDISVITAAVHEAGALCYVDGVHLTPHAPVDVIGLGADFYACSPYKFYGPHLGALAAAPSLLATLHPDKLLPATDSVPERFEFGTLPYELLAGVSAGVDFIARLAPGAHATGRRGRILQSMAAVAAHEAALLRRLQDGLDGIPSVTRYARSAPRTPTVLFTVAGHEPDEVYEVLAKSGVNAPAGNFYAIECATWLGLGEPGGVRAGISVYTNESDVDRLLSAVAALG
jgi:cysteine desulfurase family protein (TIGR01976 family)